MSLGNVFYASDGFPPISLFPPPFCVEFSVSCDQIDALFSVVTRSNPPLFPFVFLRRVSRRFRVTPAIAFRPLRSVSTPSTCPGGEAFRFGNFNCHPSYCLATITFAPPTRRCPFFRNFLSNRPGGFDKFFNRVDVVAVAIAPFFPPATSALLIFSPCYFLFPLSPSVRPKPFRLRALLLCNADPTRHLARVRRFALLLSLFPPPPLC